ncbi:hypothetical protein FB382_001149 [Nocardioides ginsengisegetis]|uniref:HNH nuclease domain-containing protein n=1 Tax=Nocardioides ginsengisegetis TaxID=661491 RepID=A0A7W3P8U8_9ACTN|nr:HNH endonuclease signature motif containing protein [Nocardioides ginsengisegetis]MBA8802858.1 hypothetical protein [Nocardioides ginsengisegetis]
MEQPTTSLTTPAGVVADAGGLLASLGEVLWAARGSHELVGTLEELEAVRSQLAAVELAVLAEIDAREVAKTELGWGSTADWFTQLAGLSRREGHRMLRHAVALAERPATRAALVQGAVSPEQVGVVLDAVDKLPTAEAVRARGEAVLLEEAGRLNATDLARAARHLVEVADPEKAEREAERALDRDDRAAHLGRFLAITEDGAGGVRLKGRGTVEDAAVMRAALLPLTTPAPAMGTGMDPETCEEGRDPRDHGARMWDALVQTAQHALDTDLPPECHGARPRVAVTTRLEVLRGRIDWATLGTSGAATTEDGLELAPSVVRRLACDADIIPIALGGKGEVLDVGRTCRLVTPAIWKALVCRDRHCAFPGCTRPPVMCHAHHIVHWADHGPTCLANLVLLCGHHHRVIHHTPWQVRLNPHDGKPEFLPPPRRGRPAVEWIRNRPRRE